MKWFKKLLKKEEKEEKIDILNILESRYEEYGEKLGVIYISKEEYKEYIKYILNNGGIYITDIRNYWFDAKLELDPAILRDEKLNQLLNE